MKFMGDPSLGSEVILGSHSVLVDEKQNGVYTEKKNKKINNLA